MSGTCLALLPCSSLTALLLKNQNPSILLGKNPLPTIMPKAKTQTRIKINPIPEKNREVKENCKTYLFFGFSWEDFLFAIVSSLHRFRGAHPQEAEAIFDYDLNGEGQEKPRLAQVLILRDNPVMVIVSVKAAGQLREIIGQPVGF